MQENYCVIMAGGVGSRFWPLSRTERPKQFIDVLGTGRTLLQQTYDRLVKISKPENILVVTNADYEKVVHEQLNDIPKENILKEPMRRNTAPCIAYASYRILSKNPNANIVVAPSDHLITKEDVFLSELKKGLDFVSKTDALLTLGIKPNRPETGYGYIQAAESNFSDYDNLHKVKTFTEKPDLQLANVFLESGDFFWNSGIFIWSLKSILKSFSKYLPEVTSLFNEGKKIYGTIKETDFIKNIYAECKNISIDYGIMEKADNVFVLCTDIGWSDLGTWGSLYEQSEKDEKGNAMQGENIFIYDSNGCVVNVPNEKLVVIQGLDDFIVVESDGMLLICKKDSEQNIRQIVNDIKIRKGEKFV